MAATQPSHYVRPPLFPSAGVPICAAHEWHRGPTPMHDHDYFEIALILAGHSVHQTFRGEQRIGAGDAVIVRPGAWHAYLQSDMDVYNCLFGHELLERELAWVHGDLRLHHLLWSGPKARGNSGVLVFRAGQDALARCCPYLDLLPAKGPHGATGHRVDRIAHLLMFLTELAGAVDEADLAGHERLFMAHNAVARSVQMMEADMRRAWTLPVLAEGVCTAPSYLVRLFRKHAGIPPMAYLAQLRLERSAELLLRSGDSISAICEEVGWSDPNYFAVRFRRRFQKTPTQFRNEHRPKPA